MQLAVVGGLSPGIIIIHVVGLPDSQVDYWTTKTRGVVLYKLSIDS